MEFHITKNLRLDIYKKSTVSHRRLILISENNFACLQAIKQI